MIFALLTPLLVLAAGGAVDVTNAYMRQTALQDATDAAAVGAVARTSPGYIAATQMTTDGPVSAPNLDANAQAIFDANRKASGDTTLTSFAVAVTRTGLAVGSVATSSATFKPSFLGLIGTRTIALKAVSHASDNIPAFVDFHLLLDNSPSMAIAATTDGIKRMVNMTANNGSYSKCGFACHATNPASTFPDGYQNLSTIAQTPTDGGAAIPTRIDVVRDSAKQLFSTAQSIEGQNGVPAEFGMAIYDFGVQAYLAPALNTVLPRTTNLSDTSQADSIDVMTVPIENTAYDGSNADEDTDLTAMLNALSPIMVPKGKMAGDGSKPTKPQEVLFLVSDGMNDAHNCSFSDGGTPCRMINPIDTSTGSSYKSACDAIKAKGITIAVLYTTYLQLKDNSFYMGWVYPYDKDQTPTQIYNSMKACASPGLFSEVSPSQGIAQAMNDLFQKVVASVKITS